MKTPAEPAVPTARVVPNDPNASACAAGYCLQGCSHMMWKCFTCQCEGGWGAPVGRLEDFAREHVCPPDPPAEPTVTDDYEAGYAEGFHHGLSGPRASDDVAVQGEPSDAQVLVALNTWYAKEREQNDWPIGSNATELADYSPQAQDRMRAALEAALSTERGE